jgi:hypothetical protein
MNVLALRWQAPLLALLSLSISGCTTTASRASDSRDPLEPINRVAHQFNEDLDRALLRPVARGYHRVVPEPLQIGVSNVFFNAKYPVTMVNNALQGKFVPALSDLGRITLNTTLGLGGLFDPATSAGLERYDEDFGQTLGAWAASSMTLPSLAPIWKTTAPVMACGPATNLIAACACSTPMPCWIAQATATLSSAALTCSGANSWLTTVSPQAMISKPSSKRS